MEVYLVGGAVRDELLGLSIKERDWVVVGSNPEEMLTQGFKQVGKDFPVFLHPESTCIRRPARSMRWLEPKERKGAAIMGLKYMQNQP